MRVALISLIGQPRFAGTGALLTVAGKTLAERQLEFARVAGCDKAILLGDGTSAEAIAMHHLAERAGLAVQTVSAARDLLGSVRSADQLLVLAPGLLPDTSAASEALSGAPAILVMPAAQAVPAGFERIDRERAWAGALVMSGALVERLSELAADIDAAPALLRIALQAGTKERPLPEALLSDGSWAMLGAPDADAAERAWLTRHLVIAPDAMPSERIAAAAVRQFHRHALDSRLSGTTLAAGATVLLVMATGLALAGSAGVGFAVLAAGVWVVAFAERVADLRASPFAAHTRRRRLVEGAMIDLSLVVCGASAIDGNWAHKLFPPLVLIGALRAVSAEPWRRGSRWLADRLLLSAMLVVAALLGLAELALMTLALVAIGLNAARAATWRG